MTDGCLQQINLVQLVKKKFKKEDEEEECVIVSDDEACETDLW